jgi:hypothetical protein
MKKATNGMKPTTPEVDENPWLDPVAAMDASRPKHTVDTEEKPKPEVEYQVKPSVPHTVKGNQTHPDYDLEGLMTDFPTAKDLERFVFDETGVVLNLKGRANKLKYQVAMDCLNGQEIDPKFIGGDNPYIDRAEMVPVEDLKPVRDRDETLPGPDEIQNTFTSNFIPHPNTEYRARNKRVQCTFRKYKNGMISYEVLGPIEPLAVGEKMDKFGKMRPELMSWIDPRTGEQVIVRNDGTLTPMGRNLKALMQKQRVNDSTYWDIWIDRDFVNVEGGALRNPWDIGNGS